MRSIIFLCLFFSQTALASFDVNRNIQDSYRHIINLEFDKANIILDNEESKNPSNGFIPLYRNYIDFLTIIITEDIDYFEQHKNLKDQRLAFLDDNCNESPYYLYSKAEIRLQWAFIKLKFEEFPTAAYEILRAYKLLQKNKKKFPEFTLNNKGLGLIHILLGVVPNDYYWILDLAGLDGDVSLGFRQLDTVLNDLSFNMYKDEVLFLLAFLQTNLGDNDAISKYYLDLIGDRYKDNLLLNFSAARLSYKLGLNNFCLNVLTNRPNNNRTIEFYYLDYLEGMCYLYKLDYSKAKLKFEYFLDNFQGVNYIKSANHKLAWIYFLEGDHQKKETYFKRVIFNGKASIDEDQVALKDAQNNYVTHSILLKARLLYDGGYYTLALVELNRLEKDVYIFSDLHQAEYWYRLARVKSKLDFDYLVIINDYKKVLVKKFANTNSYYVPMSALQIGLLYEQANNIKQAKYYFNKCLSMSGFDYERGIHQKAKSGLNRILH